MKTVSINLSENIHRLEVFPFADLHIGDKYCNMNAIKQRLELVKDNPNAVIILNGDIMNNATTSSVSDTYSETMSPMEQLNKFVEIFEPYKSQVIGFVSGNHEARTNRTDGIDLSAVVAKELGLMDRFDPIGILMFVHFGNNTKSQTKSVYSIYATHGTGGGKRPGGKINRLEDMQGIVSADCYVHSHTHCPIVFKSSSYQVNYSNDTVSQVQHLFVNTSSMLDYGGYGQQYEFKPSTTDSPIIYLYDGRNKRMEATL